MEVPRRAIVIVGPGAPSTRELVTALAGDGHEVRWVASSAFCGPDRSPPLALAQAYSEVRGRCGQVDHAVFVAAEDPVNEAADDIARAVGALRALIHPGLAVLQAPVERSILVVAPRAPGTGNSEPPARAAALAALAALAETAAAEQAANEPRVVRVAYDARRDGATADSLVGAVRRALLDMRPIVDARRGRAALRCAAAAWRMYNARQPAGQAVSQRQFAGTVAFVVGASGGTGAAVARELARRGAALMLGGRDMQRLTYVADQVHALGCVCETVFLDLTVDTSVRAALGEASRRFGRIDNTVFAAGVATLERIRTMSGVRLETVLAVNYLGMVRVLETLLAECAGRRGGTFTHISVAIGERRFPALGAFGAAKLAANTYLRKRRERPPNPAFRLINVIPGPIDTSFMDHLLNAGEADFSLCMRERRALGLLSADEVARVVADVAGRGGVEVVFPATLRTYLAASAVLPAAVLDRLARAYMDWRGVPETCDLPSRYRDRNAGPERRYDGAPS